MYLSVYGAFCRYVGRGFCIVYGADNQSNWKMSFSMSGSKHTHSCTDLFRQEEAFTSSTILCTGKATNNPAVLCDYLRDSSVDELKDGTGMTLGAGWSVSFCVPYMPACWRLIPIFVKGRSFGTVTMSSRFLLCSGYLVVGFAFYA